MSKYSGTETEKNLQAAFAGESQARNKYTYFASAAKKEGYEQIAGVFLETAEQEKEHAKRFFKFLEGGDATITASYPAGRIGTTPESIHVADTMAMNTSIGTAGSICLALRRNPTERPRRLRPPVAADSPRAATVAARSARWE